MRFIGCKTLLLDNIKSVIDENVKSADLFCDIFSGTSTVGRYFKKYYKIFSNDLLEFSYVLQKATIENNKKPNFDNFRKINSGTDPIDYLNTISDDEICKLPVEKRFFQNNYAPTGNRMYLTDSNALRIDFARNSINDWLENNIIGIEEYYYILAGIIEGIPFVSNISGTYGAFHKKWDKRAYKKFEIVRLDVYNNKKKNKSFNEDGVELLKKINGDILYIDPPYNERQYLPNYHVLETAAKYDSPVLKGITGQREYENKKSDFCLKGKALTAFETLIKNADFKHIVLSYSSDGIISISDIEEILKSYCKANTYHIYKIPYRRYKSRLQKEREQLNELIFYIQK